MPKVSELVTGVYCWHNRNNSKVYVGSGAGKRGIDRRHRDHLDALRKGTHCNDYLQKAWNKHGEAAFEFIPLEWCQAESCLEREQWWMDELKATDPEFGYNISPTAGSTLGVTCSEETKAKISAANSGRKDSPEVRLKKSQASKKMWESEEHRKRISEFMTERNKHISEETRAKISAAVSGPRPAARKPKSPEHRAKLLAARRKRLAVEREQRTAALVAGMQAASRYLNAT